ncbi:hypothetical protein [Streptomyces chartreusis]|uniref:hypothetical protein n=1 Tax=Streptomyces chartreusis TaxID=1969 RepID=UPI0033A7BCA4
MERRNELLTAPDPAHVPHGVRGDVGKSKQLQRDPKFVDNPAKVETDKAVYDGTYK